jgi:hypothetical protein
MSTRASGGVVRPMPGAGGAVAIREASIYRVAEPELVKLDEQHAR